MIRNKMLTCVLAVLMMLAFSMTAEAGRHGRGGPRGKCGFMGFNFLNSLSEEQKSQIAEVFAKYKNEMKQYRDAIAAAREKVAGAVHADTFNEADIRQACKDVSAAREEMVVLRAKIFNEIKSLLTPEQIATMKAKWEQKKERMKNCQDFRDSRLEDWIEDNAN
jgi:Spy/CpxP family protein refolding chaperone